MTRSKGEEAYAQVFQFKKIIPQEDHEELRDFLYKFSFNLNEADEYFSLLHNLNDLDDFYGSPLLERIQGMALQTFALSIRKMTDRSSERSTRRLIDKTVKHRIVNEYAKEVVEIYSHYEDFLNKFVAHQDVLSINDALSFFPDEDIILKDLQLLRELYLILVHTICSSFIEIKGEGHYYGFELEKLVNYPDEEEF